MKQNAATALNIKKSQRIILNAEQKRLKNVLMMKKIYFLTSSGDGSVVSMLMLESAA